MGACEWGFIKLYMYDPPFWIWSDGVCQLSHCFLSSCLIISVYWETSKAWQSESVHCNSVYPSHLHRSKKTHFIMAWNSQFGSAVSKWDSFCSLIAKCLALLSSRFCWIFSTSFTQLDFLRPRWFICLSLHNPQLNSYEYENTFRK